MAFAVERSRSIISALVIGRKVTSLDVTWLRREIFADGLVTREQAEDLFAVECADVATGPAWTEFLVEMICGHVSGAARGALDEEPARWLLRQADACASDNALAILACTLSEAPRAPAWFVAAARDRLNKRWRGAPAAAAC